jgi:hypothetical protein
MIAFKKFKSFKPFKPSPSSSPATRGRTRGGGLNFLNGLNVLNQPSKARLYDA